LAAYKFLSALLINSDNVSFACSSPTPILAVMLRLVFAFSEIKPLEKVHIVFLCTPGKFRDLIHAPYNP
jgi:hypothetical protein